MKFVSRDPTAQLVILLCHPFPTQSRLAFSFSSIPLWEPYCILKPQWYPNRESTVTTCTRWLFCPRSFGNASPSGSPKANGDMGLVPHTSADRQRIVRLSVDHNLDRDHDIGMDQLDNSAEMATIETAVKRRIVTVGLVQQHDPAEICSRHCLAFLQKSFCRVWKNAIRD
ncbi:hypothetical protein BT96DRAFT_993673 [Gymnopus androsaceus JB14]|uniref:Uncharacterized protein n=1 Tax=Gymnopus androsaceus JB14 TaxID=1447944 RepID=A0A6A4HNS2_9AGAR|nr:hypothetical protein BT96DRAFT_993673 [Gymnopus androsaceus JB14]